MQIHTMYSLRLSPRLMGPRLVRTLRTTPFLRDEETAPFVQDQPQSPSKPSMTQGHGRDKLKDPTQGDTDVQSAARSDSRKNQESAQSSESGDDQPLDAARQGSAGGEVKRSSAQSEDRGPDIMSGPFKDQVGGQDERHKGPGVKQGSSETAAGMGLGETIKGAFSGNKTAVGDSIHCDAADPGHPLSLIGSVRHESRLTAYTCRPRRTSPPLPAISPNPHVLTPTVPASPPTRKDPSKASRTSTSSTRTLPRTTRGKGTPRRNLPCRAITRNRRDRVGRRRSVRARGLGRRSLRVDTPRRSRRSRRMRVM